jgi:hypothetical protein
VPAQSSENGWAAKSANEELAVFESREEARLATPR